MSSLHMRDIMCTIPAFTKINVTRTSQKFIEICDTVSFQTVNNTFSILISCVKTQSHRRVNNRAIFVRLMSWL